MKMTFDGETALKLIDKLEGEQDPDLARLRDKVQRVVDAPLYGAKLTSEELTATIGILEIHGRGQVVVERLALPKLRMMLDRALSGEGVTG